MTAPKRGRSSLTETLAANAAAMRMYAQFAPRKVSQAGLDLTRVPAVDIDKVHKPRKASGKPLEKDIQRAILDYLHAHPKVAFVGRFNSGVAANQGADGKTRYTRFSTVRGFPDIHGMLKGGAAIYLEVKVPGRKATPEQALFIDMVKAFGGIAAVVYSVMDVEVILRDA